MAETFAPMLIKPTIKIMQAELINFKSVEYGKVEFACSKYPPTDGPSADILGIYGQNGSGKTGFIEALSIVRNLMCGSRIPNEYADCVPTAVPYSELRFVFSIDNTDPTPMDAYYSFKLERVLMTEEEIRDAYFRSSDIELPKEEYRIRVFDEVLKLSWTDEDGTRKNKQAFFDTRSTTAPFGPAQKRKEMLGDDRNALQELMVEKGMASALSRSFIFSLKTLKTLRDCKKSRGMRVISMLGNWARHGLFVIDTKSSGLIRLNVATPLNSVYGRILFNARGTTNIPDSHIESVTRVISQVSDVMSQLVPGLSIGLKEVERTLDDRGQDAHSVMLVARRGDVELPLRAESDGIRKIITTLSLIIYAYNYESITVAIDEFDAGVFEYLLGEILQVFADSGKGQLIFTSHNLRPLEVLDKRFLYFTTTNPGNRYVRLKGIRETNNLRDTYFRELVIGEQEEELYRRTKRFKIVDALRKVALSNRRGDRIATEEPQEKAEEGKA